MSAATRLLLVFTVAVLVASCASQGRVEDGPFSSAPLFGMIYDADNQPCAGVQLTVDGVPGPVTDIRGRFVVPDLARGAHKIIARKPGYEELSTDISFQSRTDVLHMRVTALTQLLDMAQAALAEEHWVEAESFLKRAEKLDPQDGVLRYLTAIHAYKTGDFAAAVQFLNAILAGGSQEPAVYLFLADIYEQNLLDPAKAMENLKAYLALRADADVQKRLDALKARQAKEGG